MGNIQTEQHEQMGMFFGLPETLLQKLQHERNA